MKKFNLIVHRNDDASVVAFIKLNQAKHGFHWQIVQVSADELSEYYMCFTLEDIHRIGAELMATGVGENIKLASQLHQFKCPVPEVEPKPEPVGVTAYPLDWTL